MKLITEVHIRGFRSIRDCKIGALDSLSAFSGLNNSGKSNVLRALSSFFNNETEPGVPVNVDFDYYRPDYARKKRKEISISVTFALPLHFKFRKELEGAQNLLGNTFTISKIWKRAEAFPEYQLSGRTLDLNERQHVDHFLQLIRFRYIPNRVLPLDVIKGEHLALRDVLVRRLGKEAGTQEKTFKAIRSASKSVISSMVKRLNVAAPDLGEVRLATPSSWADMVFAFGYRIGSDGIELDDSFQGSGIQSLLMFETLYLIDRDYFQRFGWRQASIWAVEEPESSLHASLEARVASYLSEIASEPNGRLQILCTTHSSLVLQYASQSFLVKKENWQSSCIPFTDARTAAQQMSKIGVSVWSHPLLFCPLEPLILVDGKFDAAFWTEAFRFLRPRPVPFVVCLEQLEGGTRTGGSDLLSYLKANIRAIESRPAGAKVVVILDWDDAKKKDQYERLLPNNPNYAVLAWPDTAFNPSLGKDFRGIERAYTDRLIRDAMAKGASVSETVDHKFVVSDKDRYGDIKRTLFETVSAGIQVDDLVHAKDFLRLAINTAGATV